LKDKAFSTFLNQNPPFELRPENGISPSTKACPVQRLAVGPNGHVQLELAVGSIALQEARYLVQIVVSPTRLQAD
jgi:hypothetical protein